MPLVKNFMNVFLWIASISFICSDENFASDYELMEVQHTCLKFKFYIDKKHIFTLAFLPRLICCHFCILSYKYSQNLN